MQTVIVTPDDIAFSHEAVLPYLEESDGFVILTPVPTDEELVELGGEATVVVTGNSDSVAAFVMTLSLYSRFPPLDDPALMDMREFSDRQIELMQFVTRTEDDTFRFEVKVTPRVVKAPKTA